LTFACGVDVARHQDFTVLSILDSTGRQVYFERFKEVSWPRVIAAIKVASQMFADMKPRAEQIESRIIGVERTTVVLDSTGVGDVVFDALLNDGVYVLPYTLTYASKRRLIDNLASNGRGPRLLEPGQ
jgi:hypothetical protein